MAKLTGDVRDVNVGSAGSPLAPVQKQVASRAGEAQAIRSLGQSIGQGAIDMQQLENQQQKQGFLEEQLAYEKEQLVGRNIVADFAEQQRQNYQDFLDSQGGLSDNDKTNLQGFQGKAESLAAKHKVSGDTRKFRALMELELKSAINSTPHLEQELRQAASASLGFQPIGEQLRQLEAQERAAQSLQQSQMKAYDDMAVRLGYLPNQIFTDPKAQQEFLQRVDANRVTMKMEELKKNQEAGLVSGKVYQQEFMTSLPKMVTSTRDQLFSGFAADIKAITQQNGIDVGDLKSPLQLSADQVAEIVQNPNAKQALETRLASYENNIDLQLRASTASFEDNALRDDAKEVMLAPVKQLRDLMSSKLTLEMFENQNKLAQTLATANVYQSYPELRTIQVIDTALGNITSLPDVQVELWNGGVRELTQSMLNSISTYGGVAVPNPDPGTPDTRVISDLTANQMKPLVDHFSQLINASDNSDPEIVMSMLNQYGKVFASPEAGRNKQLMDGVFKMMGNDQNKALLMDWMEQNPELGTNVKLMYSKYARNSVAELGKITNNLLRDLDITIDTDAYSDQGDVLIKSPIKVNYARGKFILTIDDEQLKQYAAANSPAGNENRAAQLERSYRNRMVQNVSRWQTQYLQPLNRYLADWTELSGTGDLDLAAAELTKGTSLASIFRVETGQPLTQLAVNEEGVLTTQTEG
jgi:hypothetical protein